MDASTSVIFPFSTGNTVFGQIWSNENQNCQRRLKFASKANSNMQNLFVVSTFSVLKLKHAFWANLVQKIKIVSLS